MNYTDNRIPDGSNNCYNLKNTPTLRLWETAADEIIHPPSPKHLYIFILSK